MLVLSAAQVALRKVPVMWSLFSKVMSKVPE